MSTENIETDVEKSNTLILDGTENPITIEGKIEIDTSKINTKKSVEFVMADLEEFEYFGVKFPGYFKNPHFVQVSGSFVLAIDPACMTMEMKANWINKYVPELAALGKKVLQKLLKEEIPTV